MSEVPHVVSSIDLSPDPPQATVLFVYPCSNVAPVSWRGRCRQRLMNHQSFAQPGNGALRLPRLDRRHAAGARRGAHCPVARPRVPLPRRMPVASGALGRQGRAVLQVLSRSHRHRRHRLDARRFHAQPGSVFHGSGLRIHTADHKGVS